MSSYKNFKVSDLWNILKSRGLKSWTGLRKKDLISLVKDSEEHPSDLATEDAREMGKKMVKELRVLAKVRGVKIQSGANKNEIAYLIRENYGERRRAFFVVKYIGERGPKNWKKGGRHIWGEEWDLHNNYSA